MNCPKCHSSNFRKDGTINGVQRYLCKQCLYRYSEEKKTLNQSISIKKLALEMYTVGIGLRLIAKVLKIKNNTLKQWIKDFGAYNIKPKSSPSMEVKDFKELPKYINSKAMMSNSKEALLIVDFSEGTSKLFIEKE
ncbi:MAG TPA: hypothetical protein PKX92_04815 [Edaphocola sp.]|nr:hypothetical protein [Edaphocola sp.]